MFLKIPNYANVVEVIRNFNADCRHSDPLQVTSLQENVSINQQRKYILEFELGAARGKSQLSINQTKQEMEKLQKHTLHTQYVENPWHGYISMTKPSQISAWHLRSSDFMVEGHNLAFSIEGKLTDRF